MTKIIIMIVATLLFGLNNSSIFYNEHQIPYLRVAWVLLTITIVFDYRKIKKGKFLIVRNYLKNIVQKVLDGRHNEFSIFVMIVWFVIAAISYFWVENVSAWRLTINFFIVGLFCVIAFSIFIRNKKDLTRILQLISGSIIVQNFIGWFEFITQHYLFLPQNSVTEWNGRPVSMFYNTNNFAVFLFLSTTIIYAVFIQSKNVYVKWIYGITLLSTMGLILVTQSRGVLVGIVLSTIVFVLLPLFMKYRLPIQTICKEKRKWVISTLIIVTIILTTVSLTILPRISLGESNAVRVNLIQNGLIFIQETFGRGVGAGNIEYWMENYRAIPLSEVFSYSSGVIYNIHNWWLEILVGYGVVFFGLYIVFYYNLFRNFLTRFLVSEDKFEREFSRSLIAIMIGFLVVSTVPSTLIFHLFHWVFWAVLISFQGMDIEKTTI